MAAPALEPFLGTSAGLSAATVIRLTAPWQEADRPVAEEADRPVAEEADRPVAEEADRPVAEVAWGPPRSAA